MWTQNGVSVPLDTAEGFEPKRGKVGVVPLYRRLLMPFAKESQ
jgi:hypothetical protein